MSCSNEYDVTSPQSIEAYAQNLIGKSFREIIDADEKSRSMTNGHIRYGNADVKQTKRNKGNLGQIIEECFFHYECNSDSRADFLEAGVELKVSPYKMAKNGHLSAKERLILTMIDYCKVVDEEFETSHLWQKSRLILLVYYQYLQEVQINLDYRINYARLFTPPEQDLQIIRHDYNTIVSKIREGRAHELSESDTLYLAAATKSSTSKDRRKQPFSSEPAKPRAFAFKSSYMTYVLNAYIVPGKTTYEPILVDTITDSFEEYVIHKIEAYKGYSIQKLCDTFHVDSSRKPKNLESLLAFRILGIKGNHAEEFIKANIVVKTIRIGKNNRIKENMSFPAFKFTELVEEDWETSQFGNFLRDTRFFFVVYKYDKDNVLRLMGGQFWNIPYEDLETDVRAVWEKTKQVVQEGIQITETNGSRRNNLPKASENRVCHVRPHGRNARDTYELPQGGRFPKQCFWLNNTYIYSQIKDTLK